MKATNLVRRLQRSILDHGDKEVVIWIFGRPMTLGVPRLEKSSKEDLAVGAPAQYWRLRYKPVNAKEA